MWVKLTFTLFVYVFGYLGYSNNKNHSIHLCSFAFWGQDKSNKFLERSWWFICLDGLWLVRGATAITQTVVGKAREMWLQLPKLCESCNILKFVIVSEEDISYLRWSVDYHWTIRPVGWRRYRPLVSHKCVPLSHVQTSSKAFEWWRNKNLMTKMGCLTMLDIKSFWQMLHKLVYSAFFIQNGITQPEAQWMSYLNPNYGTKLWLIFL